MSVWSLDAPAHACALVSADGRQFTYGELAEGSDRFASALNPRGRKTVGFVLCRNTPECVTAYLGALRAGHAVCLLDADLRQELLERLVSTYQPDWIFTPDGQPLDGYTLASTAAGQLLQREGDDRAQAVAAELAVLLPTSGTTGSPRLVRLSHRNLVANARSIVSYLGLTPEERGLASLPMSYSYGLSILNSHFEAGATVLLTTGSFMQREYWGFIKEQRPTSLSGVPYHYEVMLRMGMLRRELPSLRTLTQAGGRLDAERVSQLEQMCAERGWRFFVMYGQTEAAPRISYVPPERLREKAGSIGIPIPGGQLELDADTGELIYSGPNVMLGYAESRDDLSKGDELGGRLRTGDLARQDDDGFYYIVGRAKRFLKVFGKRVSLDEVETLVKQYGGGPAACVGEDDRLRIAVEDATVGEAANRVMVDILKIHPSAFRVRTVDALPRFPSGKLDYQTVSSLEGW